MEDLNKNRTRNVPDLEWKIFDETVSYWMTQTKKGGFMHISFMYKKTEPLGTEFKNSSY